MLPSLAAVESLMRYRKRIITRSGAIIAWRGAYARWCVYRDLRGSADLRQHAGVTD